MIMTISFRRWLAVLGIVAAVGCTDDGVAPPEPSDDELVEMLAGHGFTGRMEAELEDAILHHLDVIESARNYDPAAHGVPADLRAIRSPIDPVLEDIHPQLRSPIALTTREFNDLVESVRRGLLEPRARLENLCPLIPASVPSGMTLMTFQGC